MDGPESIYRNFKKPIVLRVIAFKAHAPLNRDNLTLRSKEKYTFFGHTRVQFSTDSVAAHATYRRPSSARTVPPSIFNLIRRKFDYLSRLRFHNTGTAGRFVVRAGGPGFTKKRISDAGDRSCLAPKPVLYFRPRRYAGLGGDLLLLHRYTLETNRRSENVPAKSPKNDRNNRRRRTALVKK